MSKPSPPTPPDPKETAGAQTSTNVATAIANAALKNVNQVTPYGNLNYAETGSKNVYDSSTGTNYAVPIYTATQTLSPQEQAIFNQSNSAQQNLAQTANQQSGFLKNYLAQPADLDAMSQAAQDKIDALGKARLDPQFAAEQDQFNTQMANKGIQAGSQAYDNAYRDFSNSKNDAYNQLYLNGQQQAFNQALTARQEPINEITGLLSGSQLQQPNYVNSNMPTIPTTDYAGIVNQNYQDQMGIYNSQMSNANALMGGMFSLASAPLMGLRFSDENLKEDIHKVGKVDGHNIYRFRYKTGGPMQLGVIAQEVQKKQPEAVVDTPAGKMVNYDKVFRLGAA